jgi:hypothetical protein
LNSDDVLRDINDARVERRRVYVSRIENNGRIRWVIEIEVSPVLNLNTRFRGLFDRSDRTDRMEEDSGSESR